MNFSFDRFKNLNNPEYTLCNPDKRRIAILDARQAQVTLRFNDLSELTFEVPSHTTNAKGKRVKYTHYVRVETQRLILVGGVGYFKIMEVNETEDGLDRYKSVKAQSLQVRLNDRGFFIEERIYKFFDPNNPYDKNFCGSDVGEIPSVVGQLHKQLDIQIDPRVVQNLPPMSDLPAGQAGIHYEDWTIEYISPTFRFVDGREDNVVRSFTESRTIFGYDFIINNASQIFEAIFVFDFLRMAISIKTVEEVTERTNIYLDYDNIVNELQTTERSDEIVTILNCNGSNLDIRSVNPTGTNYIANFSHFMAADDEEHPKWMSKDLSNKIRLWEREVENTTPEWIELVAKLRNLYHAQTELKKEKQFVDLKLMDLRNAIDRYTLAEEGHLLGLTNLEKLEEARAIFTSEEVKVGQYSLDTQSIFFNSQFCKNATHTAWRRQPQFEQYESEAFRWTGRFNFLHLDNATDSRTDTFNNNWLFPLGSGVHPIEGHFLYFKDNANGEDNAESYCQLIGEIVAVKPDDILENIVTEYQVTGFRRFTVFSNAPKWEKIYTAESYRLQGELDDNKETIEETVSCMNKISSRLNLQRFFDLENPQERKLLRELRDYWIEADFESSGLAVYYNTPPEEEIDLAKKLLEEGRKHLEKISQPRFSLTVDAINFTKIHAFKAFTDDLTLGRVITIHKSDGVHYFPVLTSMSWNLDDVNDFTLEFSNALKPNSQDFLFMDLVNEGSSSARKVSANWQNLTKFVRRENSIDELLHQPLNRTLRLAQGNMHNQAFVIDDTGILGRRFNDETQSTFSPEQIRIINNVLLFTDDAWQTAKTALGRIAFTHPVHGDMQAYGLLAESLVGSLIIGNMLHIANDNNTVSIDGNGITIKNAITGEPVFSADSRGNLTAAGLATSADLVKIETRVENAEANLVANATILGSAIELLASHTNSIASLDITTNSLGGQIASVVSHLNAVETSITQTVSANNAAILLAATGTVNNSATGQQVGNSLNALLALKVDRVNLISEINASANVISLNSNRLTINSDNFTLTASGEITARSGRIAGLRMDYEGLSSDSAVFSSALISAPTIAGTGIYGDYIVANSRVTIGNINISNSTLQGVGGSVNLNGGGVVETVNFTASALREGGNNAIRVNVSPSALFTSRLFVVSYRTWIPGSWGGGMGTRTVEVMIQAGQSTAVVSAIVGSNIVQDVTVTNGSSFSQTRGGNGVNVTGEFYIRGQQVRTWNDGTRTFLIF